MDGPKDIKWTVNLTVHFPICELFTFTSTQRSRVLEFFVQHLPLRVKFLKMKFLAFYRKIVQGEIKELTSHDE